MTEEEKIYASVPVSHWQSTTNPARHKRVPRLADEPLHLRDDPAPTVPASKKRGPHGILDLRRLSAPPP
jgi:hypothetical protein